MILGEMRLNVQTLTAFARTPDGKLGISVEARHHIAASREALEGKISAGARIYGRLMPLGTSNGSLAALGGWKTVSSGRDQREAPDKGTQTAPPSKPYQAQARSTVHAHHTYRAIYQ